MRFLSRFVLLSGVCMACAVPQAMAQGLSINPYPVSDGRVDPHNLDESVIRELLARQQERKKMADKAPVSLGGRYEAVPRAEQIVPPPVADIDMMPNKGVELMPDYQEPDYVTPDTKAEAIAAKDNIDKVMTTQPQASQLNQVTPPNVRPIAVAEPVVSAPAAVAPAVAPVVNDVAVQSSFQRPTFNSSAPALDHVTVIVRPHAAAGVPVAPRSAPVAQPMAAQPASMAAVPAPRVVPQAPIAAPVQATAAPAPQAAAVQKFSATESLAPVKNHVAKLDAQAVTSPASLQEKALRRGIQAQAGTIIHDSNDAQKVLDRVSHAPQVQASVPPNSAYAEVLLQEADKILDQQVASVRQQDVKMPGTDRAVDVEKIEAQRGNKIVYSEENIRDVMQAMTPMPGEDKPISLLGKRGQAQVADTDLREVDQVADINVAPINLKPIDFERYWTADQGESVYSILQQWSRDAGVDLVWNSQFLVDVRKPLSVSGAYEDAVSLLLEQYSGLRAGVSGTLHIDDVSGRKTLIINTNGQG